MANTDRNALAELAEDLAILKVILEFENHTKGVRVVHKAQRIVAELARMKPDQFACGCFRNLIDNCREIAEEGAEDGSQS